MKTLVKVKSRSSVFRVNPRDAVVQELVPDFAFAFALVHGGELIFNGVCECSYAHRVES